MNALPCGCRPCAQWCSLAEALQTDLDDALDEAACAVTDLGAARARRHYDAAERALHAHLAPLVEAA